MIITRALIDNGSILNVYSLETSERLGVKYSIKRPDGRMFRVFGGGQTVALGEIYLKVYTSPLVNWVLRGGERGTSNNSPGTMRIKKKMGNDIF